MPVTTTHSTLIILPRVPLAGDKSALERIAGIVGLSAYDVRQKCATGRAAVLLRSTDGPGLSLVRDRLVAEGHGAVVIADPVVRGMGYPLAARGLRESGGSIDFLDETGATLATLPADAPRLVVPAHLEQPGPSPVPMAPGAPATAERIREEAAAELHRLLTSTREGLLFDVAWGTKPERVRIRADLFLMATLGDRLAPGAARNMRTLLDLLAGDSGRAHVDLEFHQFQPPRVAPSPAQVYAGKPLDRPRDDREVAFESYSRFLAAAWRDGLFALLDARPLPAGDRWRMTRTLPEPGRDPAAPEAPPWWLPPAAEVESPPRRALEWLDTIGPPALVVPLAGLALLPMLAAPLLHRPGLEVLGLVPAGLLSLTHALVLFDRKRRVENVPTSRIRSAAVGPCEIRGHARAGRPLRTPFSLMPCVWYEYRMVMRETAPPAATAGADPLVRVLGRSHDRDRAEVRTGNSGEIPFFVEDETGRVEVDPRGALVEVSTTQVLHNVPFAGAALPPGRSVVITERYIPVDDPVYVMGTLRVEAREQSDPRALLAEELRALKNDARRMAAGDTNRDGTVDAVEWEEMAGEIRRTWTMDRTGATGRTDRVSIGRAEGDALFYISEKSEKEIVRRFMGRAVACFVLGLALVVGAIAWFRGHVPGLSGGY